jgi:hypothetical protein
MRRLIVLALIGLPLGVAAGACKKAGPASDAGTDGAPSASASAEAPTDAAAEASASATATHALLGFGLPNAGTPCRAGADTLGCSPDHATELTCSGGTWRPMTACRGAGVCKGTGAGTTCDVGNLLNGDPCGAGAPAARCVLGHAVQQCSGGVWRETVCMPPTTCKPNGGPGGTPGCK